uniref:Secreted protein n=1 Tax=Ascaris lumbricoides TaxID=6252 RepID=A0A0M3I099_ASCLU
MLFTRSVFLWHWCSGMASVKVLSNCQQVDEALTITTTCIASRARMQTQFPVADNDTAAPPACLAGFSST